jgi:hypothetical protein
MPYLYVPIGWERFENVLQYNSSSVGLDIPTLFHPAVHLDFEQLSLRLLYFGVGNTLKVYVDWDLSSAPSSKGGGALLAKLKLVYLARSRAVALLKSGLPTDCQDKLAKSLSHLSHEKILNLETRRAAKEPRWFYDGCRDIISENFTHLYSNVLTIRTVKRER